MAGINIGEYKANQRKKTPEPNEGGVLSFLDKDISLFPNKLSDKFKESFYMELFTLVSAGLDIRSSLELLEEEQVKKKEKEAVKKIKDDLIAGSALAGVMKDSGNFTPYEYFSVQIGEETGRLMEVLEQLAGFFTSKMKQRRQFISALSYPIIIVFTSLGAVGFMLYFIVPMFTDIFKRFGGELPSLTQWIIGISGWLSGNILFILLGIAGLVFALLAIKDKDWFRQYSSLLVLRLPLIGKIIAAIHLARFTSSMALLIGAKVPLVRAIELVKQMSAFYPIFVSLDKIEKGIMQGHALHESMSKSPIYDRKMIAMIKVGEEVNKLDVFFDKLYKQYSNDVEHRTGLLNTFLEPAMIVFLGFVVGFILVAMYLPMFQLSSSLGG